MTTFNKSLLVLAVALGVVLACIAVTVSWLEGPNHVRKEFFDHLFNERYEEASLMLNAPSQIELASDGRLAIVDHKGNSIAVPATNLPFIVGGGEPKQSGVHSMTALGNRTNGVLDSPPVTIYFSVEGSKIRIESVEL